MAPVLAGLLGWVAFVAAAALLAVWPLELYAAVLAAGVVSAAAGWFRDNR